MIAGRILVEFERNPSTMQMLERLQGGLGLLTVRIIRDHLSGTVTC
jgi:hypothetical protein